MLDLSHPPPIPDCFLVATYHTHPVVLAQGLDPEPSPTDRREANGSGVPWFVVTEIGIYVVGPDRRVGGLSGPPGYPI